MDFITSKDVQALTTVQSDFCLSIFLPTERFAATEQNTLRFKNTLHEVEKKVVDAGLRSPHTSQGIQLLKPLHAMQNDKEFWEHQSDGLAIFRSQDTFDVYRLPIRFDNEIVVGDRFYLKPLLPFLTGDGVFYILALSQNVVRLYEGSRYTVEELQLPTDVPESLAEAIQYDDKEKQLQFHTGTGGSGAFRGRSAIFHGHGEDYDTKVNILRFFQQIDRGLQDLLKGKQAPLVLAGVEYLHALYREANTYPHLLDQGIKGNPENLTPQELHQRTWPGVESVFQQNQKISAERYQMAKNTQQSSHLAISEIKEIVPAAHQGRINSLFVARDMQLWGQFDPTSQTVSIHQDREPEDKELLDLAALETFLNGGTTYVVDQEQIPDYKPLAALLRY